MNTTTLAPLPPLREVIARHGLSARRSLGQHFLLDPALAARIVRAAGPLTGRHVVEIGAGPGGLTRALLASEAESILAVEVDPRAVGALEELAVHASGRLQILAADARALDLAALVPPPRQIIANLPYNIGTSLLIGWLHQADAFEQMTLMFQEEVAQRIIAAPNSATYGRLSVLAQLLCDVRLVLRLSPQAFVPPPKVSSAVVQLRPRRPLPDTRLREALERLTAAAFGQRRKMLRRTLAPLGGEALLARAGISGERRAESLSVAEFAQLAALLA
ncbi:MAG: 16S rRNA (adenine(1518)-N(6)/adenine(1519)-N(6))-dimethyltransferase RsmA [Acidobacteriia bacterium]|nr:16S rRNA (adenine(1518)-N(6)/adenine(1519)-N(6))-dimethyltransferase RsmA [Methyloceanibacter sp.]MCL6490966.1 16S rRNA (adenine(1518)-N(6)/adenine(1519)-N(6))-dimethyltransferase RsmA [Terriglobia bacterium]